MKNVYLLEGGGGSLGIYSSLEQLKLGVGFWMKYLPEEILSHLEFKMNSPEPIGWDWCFIPISASVENLAAGGGMVPAPKFWGKNLVGIEWELNS